MAEVRVGSSEVRVTATDELRRLLDEHGVEWTDGGFPTTATEWCANGVVWHGLLRDGTIELVAMLTPEQAVEATMGPLTERAAKDSEKDSDGCGTCYDTHESRWFHCSECGFGMTDLYTEEPWTENDQPKHCPNCGRKVVG